MQPTQINLEIMCECVWAGYPGKSMAECETIGQEGEVSGDNYRAFLLRCWQEPKAGLAGEEAWRFTLVEAGDEGGKRGFARLEDVVAYLSETLGSASKNNALR